jgi:hypothetical protein
MQSGIGREQIGQGLRDTAIGVGGEHQRNIPAAWSGTMVPGIVRRLAVVLRMMVL